MGLQGRPPAPSGPGDNTGRSDDDRQTHRTGDEPRASASHRVPLILAGPRGFSRGVEIDWAKWARHIEARRRKLPAVASPPASARRAACAAATFASFRLEGLDVSQGDIDAALATGATRRAFRPRQSQRIRNHVAILRLLDRSLRRGDPLRPNTVLRWYTSVSCGLSTMQLAGATTDRLATIVERMNSPELRLQAGIQQVARLHAQLLADPVVPSFNGILARLLLRYHLGRCALPPVQFHPQTPMQAMTNASVLLPLLLELLEESYEEMLRAFPR